MNKEKFNADRIALAKRIRQVRINQGMTQEKFAEIFDISLTTYKKIETGDNQITLDELRALNEELNVSVDYLLFGKRSEWDEVWAKVENCSEDNKMHLMLRLLAYFMSVKKEKYVPSEVLTQLDEAVVKLRNNR